MLAFWHKFFDNSANLLRVGIKTVFITYPRIYFFFISILSVLSSGLDLCSLFSLYLSYFLINGRIHMQMYTFSCILVSTFWPKANFLHQFFGQTSLTFSALRLVDCINFLLGCLIASIICVVQQYTYACFLSNFSSCACFYIFIVHHFGNYCSEIVICALPY